MFGGLFAVVGLILFVVLLAGDDPGRAWRVFHINFLFFTGVSMGGVIFAASQKVAKGHWSGPIIRWNWDFGDGTTLREAYPTLVSEPSHAYTAAGNFMVRLTVTTAHGSSEVMDTVTVLEEPAVSGKVSGG